jgi:SAM-dependent methyltransferase
MPPPDAAFDALAADYDTDFTDTPIARYLRQRVHARLVEHFSQGTCVLELGCGTGEDALFLAQHGVNVTATDASPRMLAIAREKAANAGASACFDTALLDFHQLPDSGFDDLDGAFSNFGAINVLADYRALACWLSERVRFGGVVAFGVMGPRCLWELLWHGLHGDFQTATRRWRRSAHFQESDTADPIEIYYPSVAQLSTAFAPYFERVYVQPLGFWLPPSDVYGVIEKRQRLLRTFIAIEHHTFHFPFLANYADHYWIEFCRTDVRAP